MIAKRKTSINKDQTGIYFVLPFIIIFLIFGLWPLINTFRLSLTDTQLMSRTQHYTGFRNFVLIFNDPSFLLSLKNTAKIWILNFIPQLGLALLFSVWFTSKRMNLKGVGFFRTIFYLPNILMPAAVAALFASLFDYYGPANQILVRMGVLDQAMQFFRNEGFTQAIVIYIQWFMWFGQTIIVLMAGMSSISGDFYESAMIDGATSGQMFRKITLPCIRPVMIYTLITSLVGGMQMFDIPFMLTDGRGAPNGSVMTANIFMYLKYSSNKGHIGLASTVGVVVFVITSAIALIVFKLLEDPDERIKKQMKKMEKRG
ncbi:MAG: sugar ABC transporter permease [Sphaerochaetaceae bacterium]